MHDLLAGCAILDGEGLTTAFGHVSVRTAADEVCISGNAGPGLVREADDLLTLGLDGTVREGDPTQLPGEAAIHLAILARRPDVGSVCRFHGPAALAWSTLGRPLPATTGLVGDEVPWFDTSTTVTTLEHAGRLADRLGDGTAVLLRGFGAVTVGASLAEAVVRAWLLERAAAAVVAAAAIATPLPFPAAGGPAPAQLRRAWNYLTHRWPTTAEVLRA
ncbi:MAG TPA: class II aldolase/adducin family protein [Solirubrobacteraceae bacterium]